MNPATGGTTTIDPAGPEAAAAGVRFTVASRPQRRFSATQTVNNLAGSTSFAPIQLPATGHVRKISLYFTMSYTAASAVAINAGDGPFQGITGITLTDATGQPIFQPISGYNLYLLNKYLPADVGAGPWANNPMAGPEYSFTGSGTAGAATFRLDLELEQDPRTGYGCIPNLDSNASLQLKIDVAAASVVFTGTTPSASTVSVRVEQHYWAPVGSSLGGVPVRTTPPGYGDFLETRYENQNATAAAENTVNVTNKGGLIKGIIAVSRAAGVRTAFTAGSNVGLVYDNNAIDEGITFESFTDQTRRMLGYIGTDFTTGSTYGTPLTAGTLTPLGGLDRGVLAWNFDALCGPNDVRDAWLSTRVGTLLQLKVTPGASATQLELITQLMQVKDAAAFYG